MTWRQVLIGDVCNVITGYAFKSADWSSEGIPVIKIANISGDGTVDTVSVDHVPSSLLTPRTEKFIVGNDDILIAMTGATAGKVGRVRRGGRFFLNQRVAKVQAKSAIADYIWAVVSSKEYQRRFFLLADGAAQPNMSGGQIERVTLPLPDERMQSRIASIIRAYDDLLEVNRRRIAVLEEMALRLFEEWFVRLQYPGYEEHEITQTLGGPVPEGWQRVRLDQLLVLQRGFDLPASARTPGPHPVLAATGIHGTHSEAKVRGPGIVTGRSGSIGTVLLVHEDFWPLNTTLYVKDLRRGSLAYALFLLRHLDLKAHAGGAAVPTLNRNHVHALPVLCPTRDVLERFDYYTMDWLRLVRVLERQQSALASSRDHLLPRLVSGELSVSSAERELETAA